MYRNNTGLLLPTENDFLLAVAKEITMSRAKYPQVSENRALAFALESAELLEAVNSRPWANVLAEAIQVAAMAYRLATEGDATVSAQRVARGNHPGPQFAHLRAEAGGLPVEKTPLEQAAENDGQAFMYATAGQVSTPPAE